MIKKGIFLLSGYFVLSILSSCCASVSEPYFEFGSAQVEHSFWKDDNNVKIGSVFQITLTDFEYVANNSSIFNSALYAMQPCPSSGHLGPKSAITDIDVSVNQTYFDTIPKGSILNEYVYLQDNDGQIENNQRLEDYEGSLYYDYNYEDISPYLNTLYIQKNNLDSVHVFKFEIYQENGEITTIFSNAVTW